MIMENEKNKKRSKIRKKFYKVGTKKKKTSLELCEQVRELKTGLSLVVVLQLLSSCSGQLLSAIAD